VAGTHQVPARVLAGADEIAEVLLGRRRDPHEAQLAGGQESGQALGVATIGLHPVHRARGGSGPGDDPDVEPALGGVPDEPEARRPGLIGGEHLAAQPFQDRPGTASGGPSTRARDTIAADRFEVQEVGCFFWFAWTVETHRAGVVNVFHGRASKRWGVGRRRTLRPSPRTSLRGVPAFYSASRTSPPRSALHMVYSSD